MLHQLLSGDQPRSRALSTDQIAALTFRALSGLGAGAIAALSSNQIAALSTTMRTTLTGLRSWLQKSAAWGSASQTKPATKAIDNTTASATQAHSPTHHRVNRIAPLIADVPCR